MHNDSLASDHQLFDQIVDVAFIWARLFVEENPPGATDGGLIGCQTACVHFQVFLARLSRACGDRRDFPDGVFSATAVDIAKRC
jgi:hypothetical protein